MAEKKKQGEPFTAAELYMIKGLYGKVPNAEIARRLGRTRNGVCNAIDRMRKSGELYADKPERPPTKAPIDGAAGTLGKLHVLESMLMEEMKVSEGPTLARLASEYRTTLLEIERREEAGPDGAGESDVLGKLADAFLSRAGKA